MVHNAARLIRLMTITFALSGALLALATFTSHPGSTDQHGPNNNSCRSQRTLNLALEETPALTPPTTAGTTHIIKSKLQESNAGTTHIIKSKLQTRLAGTTHIIKGKQQERLAGTTHIIKGKYNSSIA